MFKMHGWPRWASRHHPKSPVSLSSDIAGQESVGSSPSSSIDPPSTVNRFGISELYRPSISPKVDLIFVHGLNGDPKQTWTSKGNDVFWPRDLLPTFVDALGVRILTYGYDSEIVSFSPKGPGVSKDKIHNHAERLVADLCSNRRIHGASERPLIFVGHSLGGLIIKRALVYSSGISGEKTEHLRSIAVSTFGVLFLGTPHRGSDLGQLGSYIESICHLLCSKRLLDTRPQLIQALKTNGETLENIGRQFSMLMDQYHLYFFHEGKPTHLGSHVRYIVEEESAAPILPDVERACIQADHSSMCKFGSIHSPGFDLVTDGIQRYAARAPSVIESRWTAELESRRNRRIQRVHELMSSEYNELLSTDSSPKQLSPGNATIISGQFALNTVPNLTLQTSGRDSIENCISDAHRTTHAINETCPPESYLIVPPGFRANPLFLGRQKQLDIICKSLSQCESKESVSCVLVCGQPGIGKTHLVKQYVFNNRKRYFGGIFWLNASSASQLEHDICSLHESILSKELPQSNSSSKDLSKSGEMIRDWFCQRRGWLLVLEGVNVSKNARQDFKILRRFLPDSKDSSIIYISRSPLSEYASELFDPMVVKLNTLTVDLSAKLLLKELHIEKPRKAQVIAAERLCAQVGNLPLAIKAIARRTALTHVPLEKQKDLTTYSRIPELCTAYDVIIDDLHSNGHQEALNLLSILCFLGQQVPVEMVHLGLKALPEVHLAARPFDESDEPDLTFTVSTLMQYGMLDRSTPNNEEEASLDSEDSLRSGQTVDVLKTHTVLQKFWIDRLSILKQIPDWLERATTLLIHSYHEANTRLEGRLELARPSDYRQYIIHLDSLIGHVKDHRKSHSSMKTLRARLTNIKSRILSQLDRLDEQTSRESLPPIKFQTSIFDRTNTMSDTGDDFSSEAAHSRIMIDDSVSPLSQSPTADRLEDVLPTLQPCIQDHDASSMQRIPSDTPTLKAFNPGVNDDGKIKVCPVVATFSIDMGNAHGMVSHQESDKSSRVMSQLGRLTMVSTSDPGRKYSSGSTADARILQSKLRNADSTTVCFPRKLVAPISTVSQLPPGMLVGQAVLPYYTHRAITEPEAVDSHQYRVTLGDLDPGQGESESLQLPVSSLTLFSNQRPDRPKSMTLASPSRTISRLQQLAGKYNGLHTEDHGGNWHTYRPRSQGFDQKADSQHTSCIIHQNRQPYTDPLHQTSCYQTQSYTSEAFSEIKDRRPQPETAPLHGLGLIFHEIQPQVDAILQPRTSINDTNHENGFDEIRGRRKHMSLPNQSFDVPGSFLPYCQSAEDIKVQEPIKYHRLDGNAVPSQWIPTAEDLVSPAIHRRTLSAPETRAYAIARKVSGWLG